MNVFSNFYLMRDICGRNRNISNLGCATAGLWHILQFRIQDGQYIHPRIFDIARGQGKLLHGMVEYKKGTENNRVAIILSYFGNRHISS